MSDVRADLASLSPQRKRLLELLLRQESARATSTPTAIQRRVADNNLPLSFAQQRLWFMEQLDPGNTAYIMDTAVRLFGRLDTHALERTLNEIIRRHEVLRTQFEFHEGQPVQVITPPAYIHLPLIDIGALADTRRQNLLEQLRDAETHRPFDLESGPLLRATLLRLSSTEHVLLFTMHHIISDAWSMGLLVREVASLYTAFLKDEASALPDLPIQYGDYAVWQREWLTGEVLDEQLRYWREQLDGAPTELSLPTDRRRPAVPTHRGARYDFTLEGELSEELRELSQREGVTLFMTLLAGWSLLLGRYAGVEDVVVGTPIAGRTRAEVEGLIGFFVNTLVMRVRWESGWTVEELLREVREVSVGGYSHQEVPFERIVEEMQVERSLSRSPLFQVAFMLQNAPMETLELPGLTLAQIPARRDKALFDLSLVLQETGRSLSGYLIYDAELFDETTIERMLEHWQMLLQGMAKGAGQSIITLPMMSEAERRQVLLQWNDTQSAYPREACVHQLFESQVSATPEAVALVFEDQQVTYAELNRRANQLAHYLQSLGVGLEVPVGISLERSVEMVVGMLAILKAGGVYVPLDASYPVARLMWMLEDAGISVLLTDKHLLNLLPVSSVRTVCLDADHEVLAQQSQNNLDNQAHADNLAYLIYTSGSTGQSKGVAVSHRAINRLVINTDYVRLNPGDTVAQVSNSSFDAITFELWGALLNGARLVILSKDVALSPRELSARISQHHISTMFLTTALFNQLVHSVPTAFKGMRQLLTGGEQVEPKSMEEVLRQGGLERLLHVYGPTETTTFASWYEVKEIAPDAVTVPVGRPIANTEFYVLDTNMQPVPIGVPGELYIGGDGVARGYWQRAELTAEKFVPHPWSHEGGQRLYRTGDQARYLAEGHIEFLGRLDHQVKVRGFRIELGEIEAALLSHPSLREAVVLMREDEPGDKRIVAYVVCNKKTHVPPDKLRSFLRENLPQYMLPSSFEYLEKLPLTPNGKVDRRALPIPDQTRPEIGDYVAPRTPTEEILASLWSRLLGVERVGVSDNFFELGGHSLLATQMNSWVRDTFKIEVPLAALFEQPTIDCFAARIEDALNTGQKLIAPPIVPVPRTQALPLSFAQQRLWFIEQLQPGTPLYNVYIPLRLTGQLNISALSRTLIEVLNRHEALRTCFRVVDDQPTQVIQPPAPFMLPLIDLGSVSLSHTLARYLVKAEAARPFDLERAPLLRATLLRLSSTEHVLLFTMHHIISDAWRMGILVREVASLYTAFMAGEPSQLSELPIQYGDYAVWQREWLRGEVLDEQLGYWREQLDGAPTELSLPTDHPRPPVQSHQGASEAVVLDESLTAALRELSQREGVTLFMTLLAAWSLLLGRYAGVEDVLVGTPIAGRTRAEVEGLIGFFVNTLVMRVRWESGWTVEELLREVREISVGGYSHQEVPFERIVEEMQVERSLSRTPIFQVMLVLQNAPMETLELPGLSLSGVEAEGTTAKFDLTLTLSEEETVITGSLNYNRDIFEGESIRRMLRHLEILLKGMTANPDSRLSDLPLLSEEELHQLLYDWNSTAAFVPTLCIHQLFEAQVERTPDATALVYEGERLSYRELNERANQLGHYLRKMGVGPETLVAVMMERSIEMVVALLGVLKAGGAYVPLDPLYPQERLSFIFKDARVEVLLTTRDDLSEAVSSQVRHVVRVEHDQKEIARQSEENLLCDTHPQNLIYVIYTSGSTGQPKGVLVSHANVARLFAATQHWFDFNERDVWTLFHSYAFDFSVWELWGALLYGGRLVVVPFEVSRSPEDFYRLLSREHVTVLNQTPSAFSQLITAEEAVGIDPHLSLRLVIFGGEALELRALSTWLERHGDAQPRLVNMYGITETTVHVTYRPLISSDLKEPAGSRIGRAIPDLQIYLLDQSMRPVPVGVPGEIYVGGDGLARGYLNRPELTTERFIPDPWSGRAGARLYRSGDLARWTPGGELEYLGRIDRQVKIRGFRIELGDIEAVLAEHEAVQEAVVIIREETNNSKRLVAYVVAAQEQAAMINSNELRRFVKERLPDYMVPSAFVMIDALPLTTNGKLDYKALPPPDAAGPDSTLNFVAPQSDAEQTLARIWAEVLGVEQVGIYDNFFELGGDSILSIQIISRARQCGLHLSPRLLFQHQTISELAALAVSAASEPAVSFATQGIVSGAVPLTPIQRWFFSQELEVPEHWNQSLLLRVKRRLEVQHLWEVLEQVQRHHDALRMRFSRNSDGHWAQHNAGEEACSDVPLLIVDLSRITDAVRQREVIERVGGEGQRSLDLEYGPVWRAVLMELGAGESQRLMMIAHHLVMDAVSWRILLGDVERGYEQAVDGSEVSLGEKSSSYGQWAEELEKYAGSEQVKEQAQYWLTQSQRAAVAGRLPVDYLSQASGVQARAGENGDNNNGAGHEHALREKNLVRDELVVSVELKEEETRALLREVTESYRAQVEEVLLCAVMEACRRWTGHSTQVVEIEGHGREEINSYVDVTRTVGWFTTKYPVVVELADKEEVVESLKRVKEEIRGVPERGIGYGILRYLSESEEVRDALKGGEVWQMSFNYLGQLDQVLSPDSRYHVAQEASGATRNLNDPRLYLLEVDGYISTGKLRMNWVSSRRLHRADTLRRLGAEFLTVLRELIKGSRTSTTSSLVPSDFPLANLSQQKLDKITRRLSARKGSQSR